MDQFCQLKNEDYRRCSCSNRVLELAKTRETIQAAGEQLTVFTENLDVVGMTAAQATAMRTASEGENALTSDTSTSKALLQAIMNSIRGTDNTVGGRFSDLNSINLSFDMTNAFGITDSGQVIASYDGQDLYSAVYPQCRAAVAADCNDASLQRAVTAYLMAIEQDCNTVQTALTEKQKQMKAAIREGGAMLDLARVENRQQHNSDSIAECMTNVQNAILSEEVCGAGYHKCLDNGQFIDVDTGAPIAGVVKFNELEKLLTFAEGVSAADQKLSQNPSNRVFVQNFEKRVKKFAEPALDKCREQADVVWAEYLDNAMLDIYYAQKSKVAEIKQGCFDFVSTCYMNGDTALTAAMKGLVGDNAIVLQPDKVALESEICKDYINSCDNMFGGIIKEYIDTRQNTDTVAACRAIVQQCFDKYGGTGYQNFYYPYSGLFETGRAGDWFTLYEYSGDLDDEAKPKPASLKPVSPCARQLAEIDACNTPEIMEQAFGGFDVVTTKTGKLPIPTNATVYYYTKDEDAEKRYGSLQQEKTTLDDSSSAYVLQHRALRPTGAATDVYNQVVDALTTQCINLQGRFVEMQNIEEGLYMSNNLCESNFKNAYKYTNEAFVNIVALYGISENENMCPRDYTLGVDTKSWGACLCWENGGRRSKNGTSAKCLAALPIEGTADPNAEDAECANGMTMQESKSANKWCIQKILSSDKRVCPLNIGTNKQGECQNADGLRLDNLPKAIQ